MKTRGRNGRVVFIVLSVLQFQENNEYRLVNIRVNSIVFKWKTSHELMKFPIDNSLLRIKFANYTTLVSVLKFEFIIKNCGNNTVFIVTSARRLCNHLGLYVRMCVCVCVYMCVCVFVCEHDNSKNNKHFDAKFCTYICHCLRKS